MNRSSNKLSKYIHALNKIYVGETAFDESKLPIDLINYMKITSFSPEKGKSFYREREWRKIGDFGFNYTDIAAIIVPKKYVSKANDFLSIMNYPEINILSWELLKEI